MAKVTIVNKRTTGIVSAYTYRKYVGRPSILGNPFKEDKDNSRHVVVVRYAAWLALQLRNKNKRVINELRELKEVLMRGFDLELECWCTPLECHADIIKQYLEE